MSVFGKIMSAIFGSGSAGAAAPAGAPAASSDATAAPTGAAGATTTASASAPAQSVDVAAIMDKLAGEAGQKLNWRTSIVDLMKLLNLDSSLAARKELATELKYSGDMSDSASMNIWLHKQVMQKLAANGGKVPDDLKH
jgi:Domain of unknown function (DUF3597)